MQVMVVHALPEMPAPGVPPKSPAVHVATVSAVLADTVTVLEE